jgi:hypothetical protein
MDVGDLSNLERKDSILENFLSYSIIIMLDTLLSKYHLTGNLTGILLSGISIN